MNKSTKSCLRLGALALSAALLAGCVDGYATVRPAGYGSVWVSGAGYGEAYDTWACPGWPGYGYCGYGYWPGYVTVYGGRRYHRPPPHHPGRQGWGGHGWSGPHHAPPPSHGAWHGGHGSPAARPPSGRVGPSVRRP